MADVKHIQPYQQRRLLTERIEREFPGAFVTADGFGNLLAHIKTPQGSTRVFPVRTEADLVYVHRAVDNSDALSRAYNTPLKLVF